MDNEYRDYLTSIRKYPDNTISRGVQPGVDHRPGCQGGCPAGGHLHHQRQL